MIVRRFIAKKVFSYLDFDISFNNDITFLIGGNGSGKTTALKLMNALVTPNFQELLQIPLRSASLEIEDNGETIVISATNNNESISLTISNSNEELVLPSFSNAEFDYYSHKEDKIGEIFDELNRKYTDHPVVHLISKIESPIFLGLDRRREHSKKSDDYYDERNLWLRKSTLRHSTARRLIKGSIGISLMETELLVQNAYRRMRERENLFSRKLRDSILLSVFRFTKIDEEDFDNELSNLNSWKEKSGIVERKKEILVALSNMGIEDTRLNAEVENFFYEINSLFESLNESERGLSIEWLLNKAQIERMLTIVEIIDDHKSKIDKLFKPINDFLETVNDYYSDSNKTLEIDTVGQLTVRRPDDSECTIEGLSSGERQLLVIFAHSYFNRHQRKNTVFIIDEPELSLHLGWQEKFAHTIFSINPKSQYVLATHSPEIVGENKHKSKKCR